QYLRKNPHFPSGPDQIAHTATALLLAMSLATPALGQSWTRQSPLPTSVDLGGVAFVSPTHGFIVGGVETLFETTDGGVTWLQRTLNANGDQPFYDIAFPDALHGYIAGNNNDAWRTVNGGATWTQMTNMPAGSGRVIDFQTPTTGFVGVNG